MTTTRPLTPAELDVLRDALRAVGLPQTAPTASGIPVGPDSHGGAS